MKSFTLIIFLSFLGCSKEYTKVEIIDSFIKEIIIQENMNTEDWNKYIDFADGLSEKCRTGLNEIIKMQIKEIKIVITNSNNEYLIVNYYDLEKYNLTRELRYDEGDNSNIYFLICENEIVTPIIIKEGKIYSFFWGLNKTGKNSHAWPLNKGYICD